jgi:nucleoside-diphosphate-sugar epimerase
MGNEKKVSILGCGWLGLPVAVKLISLGYQVNGSTTTPAKLGILEEQGINPFLIDLTASPAAPALTQFLESTYLLVAFPPGLRTGNGENYLRQIENLREAVTHSPVQHILFVSSTGVYPDLNREVTEAEDLGPFSKGNILLQAENRIGTIPGITTTILRMAGLVGGSRQAGRFLAGKQNIPNPGAPVNLVHLNDCEALITTVFERNIWGEIFNVCADKHPTRETFYTAAAQKLNLPLPHFAPAQPTDSFKIISNQKIKKALDYRFIYPDPMLFL